ncbi:MAG TPA: Gfo/Idh/MocA family oxidoreductase [Bryobacteraceae bacterium]|nr:Gfo/Idh/MocA family oxidoreductase [Bryobacteraceae bacterium]
MQLKPNLSRRHVIGALALTGIQSTAADSAITVGLIGCGDRGILVARLLKTNPNARLVALCDIFEDRIEKAKREIPVESPRIYKDFRKLLASDVDAVIIATPVFLHPEHFEGAVQAKKHIYIEKPAAVDVAGCKRVMRAADLADRRLNIAFGLQARYGPGYHKAKRLIDSGGIGSIRMAHAHFIKGDVTGEEVPVTRPRTEEEKIRQWKLWRDTYGDIIVETYTHGIDVLNWFLGGHALKAYGTGGRTIRRDGDNMDHVDVTFTYANSVQAAFTGSQITPRFYRSAMEQFYGSTGVIETSRQYWTHYRGKDDATTETIADDITINAVNEFVRRIQSGSPENTGVRGAESTLTSIMGRMAIDLKREVSWEEVMAG